MSINLPDIDKYFRFISTHQNPENEIFTYCLLDAESKNVITGFGIGFGIIQEITDLCDTLTAQKEKFTLHTTLNSTKLTGRKTKDIEGVRVFCVDFDREVSKNTLKPLIEANHVQMVVESSPGKYHFYWKIDPAINLESWHTYQLGLNQFFGGDLQMAGISHTIRVPGVSRVTKDDQEFMPSIVYMAAEPEVLGSLRIRELFPWIFEKAEEAEAAQTKNRRNISHVIKNSKSGPRDFTPIIRGEDRNSTLFSLIYGMTAPVNSEIDSLHIAALEGQGFNLALAEHPKGPLGEDEVTKTVESAFERGIAAREKRKAREAAKLERILGEGASIMHINGHIKDPAILENGIDANNRFEYNFSTGDLRDSPYTDLGFDERVIQRFGSHLVRTGAIIYAFDSDACVWRSQRTSTELLGDFIAQCARDIVKEEGFIKYCENDKGEISEGKYERLKNRFLSHTFTAQAVKILLMHSGIVRKSITSFDANHWVYYCANGVIDLKSVSTDSIDKALIRKPVPTDYLLRRSNVVFDSTATCPAWINLLQEIFSENEEPQKIIDFIQEIFGYTLTGSIGEQCIFLHSGEGSNGKSRILYALSLLMGDYSALLQSNTLTKSKNSVGKEMERIGAKIEGKRCVIIDDLDTRTQWNDGLVKSLTCEHIVSRKLYAEEQDIKNTAKFHLACNETPGIEGNSYAMFRRVLIIEYRRKFEPDNQKLKEINQLIERELSGIFNWALTGLSRWFKRGRLFKPVEVIARAEEYTEANAGAELLVPEMFSAPESEADEHTIQECINHANDCTRLAGYLDQRFKPETLGRILRKLGFKSVRKIKNRSKQTFYFLTFTQPKRKSPFEVM